MRLIVEVFGRAWMLTLQNANVVDPSEVQEEYEHAPVDPHSVGGCMIEHASGCNASLHASDPVARKFGFHGGQG